MEAQKARCRVPQAVAQAALGMDDQPVEIRAIEVTDNSMGDATMLPELLGQVASGSVIASLSADGACDTKDGHAAIAQRGAQAVIPPRKNGRLGKANGSGTFIRDEALRACRALGQRIWKKSSGYPRRSWVETKLPCFKRLGKRVDGAHL